MTDRIRRSVDATTKEIVFSWTTTKSLGGKIERERSKPWRLWRVSGIDSHKIQLVAEADTQEELYRKHKRRLDWHCKTYHNGLPVIGA